MELYTGIDLHSNNLYAGISDGQDRRIYRKRLPNRPDVILAELEVYKKDLVGVVVESTFNWYWLVDLLMDNGYRVHLANPAAIQQYNGKKHSNDKDDAFWLEILPEGYIYPKEDRPVRDLLRKRGHLVRLRTSLIISRNCGCKLSTNKIKQFKEDHVSSLLSSQEDLLLRGGVSKETIDYLSRQIRKVEGVVEGKVKLREPFTGLRTVPGIGRILALTIMLETGTIERFPSVGDFSSYCRKVPTKWPEPSIIGRRQGSISWSLTLRWHTSCVGQPITS